ncbi:hypothetical protein NM688_g7411 [Phlebia brevispora]|uniref:Uncharacterized protein n=1 Tax=Phlebia brevispora TaxID=194682 RepID=A0ACC1S5E7_9APHY|nr:hypothetical protein NM688_g7411 [Phlebia brevispora]
MFVEDDIDNSQDDFFALALPDHEWQPILHASNQVVLYNPTSHALSVQRHSSSSPRTTGIVRRQTSRTLECPYCHRFIPNEDDEGGHEDSDENDPDDHLRSRAPDYFQLLQISNETASLPSTPSIETPVRERAPSRESTEGKNLPFSASNMAEGYFEAFFQEECRLGMGANGSVYLCRHVLNGNPLGHFAVKKVAVGQSTSYLLNILREVRLLEKLHHPNIITYHHTWLETCQFSSFGPKVPTLHILMQWAEGGSLDDFIDARLGKSAGLPFHHVHPNSSRPHSRKSSSTDLNMTPDPALPYSRGARIRAFRAMQNAPPEERERLRRELAGGGVRLSGQGQQDLKAVHLLSAEEVKSLFHDVVEGLAFLHEKSILHLDLKPGNVLLTWDEGKLIPRAMLSDFGTSQDMLNSRARSGNTGTLEYASPESLPSPTGHLSQVDSKSDMWSLGMILHKLLFFRLPYQHASDSPRTDDSRRDGKEVADLLEEEVLRYPGFKSSQSLVTVFDSRHLPRALLLLLEGLLNVRPSSRPSCERVLLAIKEGKFDPVSRRQTSGLTPDALKTSLVPVLRRHSHDTQATAPSRSAAEDGVYTATETKDDESRFSAEIDDDKAPILGLPAPQPEPSRPPTWATIKIWNRRYDLDPNSFRIIVKKTVKSSILVFKVWTLFRLTIAASIRPYWLGIAFGLAIMDTWFDGYVESIALGLVHLALIRFVSH